MAAYVKRVGDLTEPVELSASQIAEKMTSTIDSEFDPVANPSNCAGIECKAAMESMLGAEAYVSHMQGCAFERLWSWREKNGIQDLKEARERIDNMIRAIEGDGR